MACTRSFACFSSHFTVFFKLGVTASAIGMVFIQYERCSHVKILLLLLFPRCPRTAKSFAFRSSKRRVRLIYKPWCCQGSGRWPLSCALPAS